MATALREPTSESLSAQRRAFVVVGMHRSGTSAMTRTLSLLGAALPKNLMAPKENDNEAGFWEPWKVAQFNDEILNAVDSEWDDVFAFRPKEYPSDVERCYLGRATDLLKDEFEGSRYIVLKDPRISILTNFWDRALQEAGYARHYVVMVRNPLEVAESLRARDSFPVEKSLLLWSSYMIAADRDTRDRQRIFVSYDQLMADWRSVRDRIEKTYGVSLPRNSSAAADEIDRQLDPRLRQHRLTDDDLFSRSDTMDSVKTLYRIFSAACDGAPVDRRSVDAIHADMAKMNAAVGPLLADQRTKEIRRIGELAELRNAHADVCNRADVLDKELTAERSARQADAETAAQVTADHDQEIRSLNAIIIAARADGDRLAAELNEKEQQAIELRTRISSLEGEFDRISVEVAAERRRADENRHEAEALAREMDLMRADIAAERNRQSVELAKMKQSNDRLADDLRNIKQKLKSTEQTSKLRAEKLSERFSEIAKLSSMLLERDEKLKNEMKKAQRFRWLYSALSTSPRWWAVLPSSRQVKLQQKRLRRLGVFDGESYLKMNPDVAAEGVDPLYHYINHGIDENRRATRED